MLSRCSNPNQEAFARYGKVGIVVCDRWKSFNNFVADMGERPAGTTIDRLDNARGYEPGNCRWATIAQQARNRSDNVNITINGRTLCVEDWATHYGLKSSIVRARMSDGWDPISALTTPLRHPRVATINGITKTLAEWGRAIGLRSWTICNRLDHGWNVEDACTAPLGRRRRG